jgi:predicted permease
MKGVLEDVKHAIRIYRRTPGSSLIAVGVLAIGMAFVAAFVSLYVDLILRPHPGFEESNRLVTIGWSDGRNTGGLPLDLIDRIAQDSVTLEAAAGAANQAFSAGSDATVRVGELVTRKFFSGIRPRLARGRGFLPEEHEPDAEPVAVISHRYWQEAFDGRPDALGTSIEIKAQNVLFAMDTGQLNETPAGTEFRIVGIMAPEFTGTLPQQQERAVAFWLPIERVLPMLVRGPEAQIPMMLSALRAQYSLRGIATRNANADAAAIASELNTRFSEDLPNAQARPGMRFDALDGLVFNPNVQRSTQRQLLLFLGTSALLAIVAAANVSLFLLARAPGRRRELGIRMAVGAPLKRLARQLASEASVLVVTGSVLGLVLSIWLAEFLRGLTFLRQAQWRNVTLLDWRVLAIIGAILGLLTLLVSLAPILGLKKLGIAANSRQVSARATVAQRVAGTAQIAIAGVLGGAAIAFAWYLGSLMLEHPGYETRDIHALRYSVRFPTGRISPESLMLSQVRAREAIAALPGVAAVSLASAAPGVQAGTSTRTIPHPEKPGETIPLRTVIIDADYIDLLGFKLLHGRSPKDTEPTAVLLNRKLAQQLFGRDDVVGESLAWNTQGTQRAEIVGVLDDLSFEHPLAEVDPTAFVMSSSGGFFFNSVAFIESPLPSANIRREIQSLVDSGALEVSIGDLTPLATYRSNLLAPDRARSFLTIGTAALVVLLAAFGFYGTQHYLVAAGRREYAIRASVGAGPRALGRLVVARGFALGLPGLALGLPFAFMLVAWLRDDYISRDVSPALVTLVVAAGLAGLLLVASVGPARNARATQPAPLLRQD